MASDYTVDLRFRNRRFKDAARGLSFLAEELNKDFKRAGPVLKRELKRYLETIATALARRHGNPWPGGTTAKTLSRRSGKGMTSIRRSVRVTGNTIETVRGRIGGSKIMAVHEKGATIRARRATYLTIPLPEALNSNGTPKRRSARDWSRTFVAKSRQGNLLIFQRRGREIVPLYVLKREVKIPPRLGMAETIEKTLPLFRDEAVEAMLKEFLK